MKTLANCEEQILMVVYKKKEAPALRDVMDAANQLYGKDWKPQTISTFLNRCVTKGYLTMQKKGRYCYYYPVISLDEYQKLRFKEMRTLLYNSDEEMMKTCLGSLFDGNLELLKECIDKLNK